VDRPQALKRTPEGMVLVEIECDRPAAAAEALAEREGIERVRLHGAGLHVTVPAQDEAAAGVRQRLEEERFAVTRADAVAPSLEDVFISLTERGDERPEVAA
jgi:ABC-type uncharacterized transport system ATPase subunit